jgi:hypothetical protein
MLDSRPVLKNLLHLAFIAALSVITACGTINVAVEDRVATPTETPLDVTTSVERQPTPIATPTAIGVIPQDGMVEAIAWYGEIHSVSGADPHYDYLKLWHLGIWHKFGRAVGVFGDSPAIEAEIARIRDRDVRVTVWGALVCGVGDYGACQLRVTRFSANDGGPTFEPERIERWEGTIGWLPGPPRSLESVQYFVLAGEIPVLYGITSTEPAVQEQLHALQGTGTVVRIWGELRSRVQPVTGTQIDIDRLEILQPAPQP